MYGCILGIHSSNLFLFMFIHLKLVCVCVLVLRRYQRDSILRTI